MIRSMTGYGKSEAILKTGKITVEIKTLNGKNADIALKTFLIPRDKELAVRQKIANKLQRGNIDVFFGYEPNVTDTARQINKETVKEYYSQMEAIAQETGCPFPGENLMSTLVTLPDVFNFKREDLVNEDNWVLLEEAIDNALEEVDKYRRKEGVALYADITSRVRNIMEMEDEVEVYANERIEAVRAKIVKAIEDLGVQIDKSRFEQEMIYYMEKLDINEEKVRLRQHCSYFMDTIDKEEFPGKKLGFIIQEMGREINTTGSKANHYAMQQLVVRMKDELEKIREQSLNIL